MANLPRPWPASVGMQFLIREHQHRHANYHGLCAHLTALSLGYDSSGANANDWGRSIPAHLRHTGPAPRGSVHFWLGGTYGHVARGYGPESVLCNDSNGNVTVQPCAYYGNMGPHFWVAPADVPHIVSRCGGVNPWWTPPAPGPTPPGPTPGPTPPPAKILHLSNLHPGKTNHDVAVVQSLLHLEVGADFSGQPHTYGPRTKAAYSRWQHHLGYDGPAADGIPGPKSLTALAAPHGYTITA